MISNERPSPYGSRNFGAPKPHVNEDTLRSGTVQIERKTFVFTLKENPRGRFLRITEEHYRTAPVLYTTQTFFDAYLRDDAFARYHRALMESYFHANRNITEPASLVAIAGE